MSHENNEQGSLLELAKYRLQVAKEDLETALDNEKAGHRIAIAEEVRHNSDYDEFYIVSREETQKQIQTATELINEVDKFLDEKQEK